MDSVQIMWALLPLDKNSSSFSLAVGTPDGLRKMLGSRYEKLTRRIDCYEWSVHESVKCLIADGTVSLEHTEDDFSRPCTAIGMITRMLYLRYEKKALSGWDILAASFVRNNSLYLKESLISCAADWQLSGSFLKWLILENRWHSTLSDCSEWVIETTSELPIPAIGGIVRYVPDLEPYYRRNEWMQCGAVVLVSVTGMLCGLDTIGSAMRAHEIRTLLGKALTEELMAVVPFNRDENLEYAARVCAYLENTCSEDAWPGLGENLIFRICSSVLPALISYQKKNNRVPPCLCFVLSSLIMLYSGIRVAPDGGYSLFTGQDNINIEDSERGLKEFSKMSCDMSPESLAYAALSDQEIWGIDLRVIPHIEEMVVKQLGDMQLLGMRSAISAWAGWSEDRNPADTLSEEGI